MAEVLNRSAIGPVIRSGGRVVALRDGGQRTWGTRWNTSARSSPFRSIPLFDLAVVSPGGGDARQSGAHGFRFRC